MFFNDSDGLIRVLITSLVAYLALVFLLRISGNRTLSKMNSFDLVVTVALGSTLSSGILQRSVPIAETLLSFSLLIGLQFLVTWASVRFPSVDKLVKSEPKLIFKDGRYLKSAMKEARVTEDEIQAAIRQQGFASLERIQGVILETNGRLSVF